jgi:Methyltransferase domain
MSLLAGLPWAGEPSLALGSTLRRRRFKMFLRLIDQVLLRQKNCRILDIGGEPWYWQNVSAMLGDRRVYITLLNLTQYHTDDARLGSLVGDARDLGSLEDQRFDLIHSNSVIEHVGQWEDMQAMANEIRRIASGYFVQSPYFWFPFEPHCMRLFFHWLPEPMRVSMQMRHARGHWDRATDIATAIRTIESAVLLDVPMFSALFPDAAIHRERVCGLTKSLIAVRSPKD